MKDLHLEREGNCVAVYKFGSTTVRVCDDYYRDKTQEEIDQVIWNIEEIYIKSQQRKMLQQMQQKGL